MFWIGLAIFCCGSGPLLVILLLAGLGVIQDPNPIGFGLLAFLTFWPGIGLMIAGVINSISRNRSKGNA